MNHNELQKHIFSTYITLRYGVALIAFGFPVLLYLIGRFYYGINLEDSMSHYYYSLAPQDLTMREFPMRVWFVGLLFAIGVFLYLYKGFSVKENIALNIAGISALGVALFPMDIQCSVDCSSFSLHGASAIVLFLAIGFVCLKCTKETLQYLNDPKL